jgi:predicted  nucleic acid-binding Zn-ribbon protein
MRDATVQAIRNALKRFKRSVADLESEIADLQANIRAKNEERETLTKRVQEFEADLVEAGQDPAGPDYMADKDMHRRIIESLPRGLASSESLTVVHGPMGSGEAYRV